GNFGIGRPVGPILVGRLFAAGSSTGGVIASSSSGSTGRVGALTAGASSTGSGGRCGLGGSTSAGLGSPERRRSSAVLPVGEGIGCRWLGSVKTLHPPDARASGAIPVCLHTRKVRWARPGGARRV